MVAYTRQEQCVIQAWAGNITRMEKLLAATPEDAELVNGRRSCCLWMQLEKFSAFPPRLAYEHGLLITLEFTGIFQSSRARYGRAQWTNKISVLRKTS